jgi:hypothetical protein
MTDAWRGDYSLCGWRVASALRLPELPVWAGDDRAPDLTIELGPVPATLADPTLDTVLLQLDARGNGRFEIASVAAYLIEDGRRIVIEPRMDVDAPDIRLFLFGTPFGLLCHQRGQVPLHAAAVEVDGKALLFAGSSGMGKSTLAAAFGRRGHRLLSDDVAPFRLTADGAEVMPGLRRLRLWRDSIEAAGWDAQAMEQCRAGIAKFSHGQDGDFVPRPLAPLALVHLERQPEGTGEASFQRLRGRDAVNRVSEQVFRIRTLGEVAGKAEGLMRITRAAAAIPQHFVLRRPVRFAELDAHVDMILETVRRAA